MKTTKKNGAKRNPVLVLAVLGLLIGAGATGAIAAGLVPNIDNGVTGTVTATINDAPLLTLSGFAGFDATPVQYMSSTANVVKFAGDVTVAAPGSTDLTVVVTVNRVMDTQANALLITLTGMGEYIQVGLVATHGAATRVGNGEWLVTGAKTAGTITPADGVPADGDAITLVFTVYASQASTIFDGSMANTWDFSMSEVNANMVA